MGFSEDPGSFHADFGQFQLIEPAPLYDGVYVVDPDFKGRILETAHRQLTDDITVNPILVSRTGNASGGTTVYIGGIING